MKGITFLLVLMALATASLAQTASITHCEWFTGADPGVGNATAIPVGAPEAEAALDFSVPTNDWLSGQLMRVKIRCRADSLRSGATGIWGTITEAFVITSPATGATRLITQLEYRVDNGSFTPVDVPDGAMVSLNEIVSTTGLTDGLHRLRVRATDDAGRTGLVHDGFFVVSNSAGSGSPSITEMEYRLDGGGFTLVDVADAPFVNFAEILATNALDIGLHILDVRGRDDFGRIGAVHRAYLIVTSPFVGGQTRSITGAEFFVNADPGEGSGVPIYFPQDGLWDSGEETADTILTSLPVGMHLVGMRVRDDLGRWSKAATDSILVGPILVIHYSGNDIVLDWQSGSGVDKYLIYRATSATGTYAAIDSTAATTYTDPGILTSQDRQFYRVTFRPEGFSEFRIPETPTGNDRVER